MDALNCIEDCLNAKDPLRREIVQYLVEYSEEDERLDYKFNFVDDQMHWLEIVKDISAFANTFGGYLLFGIEDGSCSVLGIDRKTAKLLKDTNKIQQKINRNLEPPISTLRAKEFRFDGKATVCIHVPRSKEVTHMISKDGEFTYPSGKKKGF